MTAPASLLGDVRDFSIAVTTGAGHQVTHAGTGLISVECREQGGARLVVWRESGRWSSGPLAGLAFHNSTLWRYRPGESQLELSHLRRGDDAATFLVTMAPDGSGTWRSERPHHCGPDTYEARLSCTSDELELCWDVASPSDPYRLRLTASRTPHTPLN